MNPRLLLALVLVALFALAATVLAAGGDGGAGGPTSGASRFEGAVMPRGVRAPDFSLRDEDGDPVSMRGLRGRPVVVTFLYTHCEDTCPLQAQTVRGALDLLGHDVPALAVAVDPPNDTQASARAFLSKQRVIGRMRFVLGSRELLKPLWDGFHIRPQEVTEEHQSRFTLVDARGYQRVGYPGYAATPETLAHDIRLLEEEAG